MSEYIRTMMEAKMKPIFALSLRSRKDRFDAAMALVAEAWASGYQTGQDDAELRAAFPPEVAVHRTENPYEKPEEKP